MATTTNLLLNNQDTGANSNTWGIALNLNFSKIDAKLGNMTTVATTSGTEALTESQERVNVIKCTGTLVGNLTLEFSGRGGTWIIWNATSGAFSVTAKVTGQTGVVIPQSTVRTVFCDGTDIREGVGFSNALSAIAALTPAADRLPYYTSASAAALATFTAASRAMLVLTPTDGNIIVGNGSTWVAESGATARTSLGLGTLATLNSIDNSNWSGTDLSVANGGTGASTLTGLLQGNGTGAITGGATINNGNWSGTDLSVANGGTGQSSAPAAGDAVFGVTSTSFGRGVLEDSNITNLLDNVGSTTARIMYRGISTWQQQTLAAIMGVEFGTTKGSMLYHNGTDWAVLAPP